MPRHISTRSLRTSLAGASFDLMYTDPTVHRRYLACNNTKSDICHQNWLTPKKLFIVSQIFKKDNRVSQKQKFITKVTSNSKHECQLI